MAQTTQMVPRNAGTRLRLFKICFLFRHKKYGRIVNNYEKMLTPMNVYENKSFFCSFVSQNINRITRRGLTASFALKHIFPDQYKCARISLLKINADFF